MNHCRLVVFLMVMALLQSIDPAETLMTNCDGDQLKRAGSAYLSSLSRGKAEDLYLIDEEIQLC